jgi:asparagine synthase (glutamine-hydrolysing)
LKSASFIAQPTAADARAEPAAAVAIRPEFGWTMAREGEIVVWTKGYGRGANGPALARFLAAHPQNRTAAALERYFNSLDGHFALAANGPGFAVAAVDWVRSIPLAFARCGNTWSIDDQAWRLRGRAGLTARDLDDDAALAVAMSGYTIDTATLYRGLHQLGPGEFVLFAPGEDPSRHRFYCYRPWRADKLAYEPGRAKTALSAVTLQIVDEMMKSLEGRELVVPLSAGRDSRLVVSAARHLGYRNVRCFAYGRAGNFEAEASKAIADKLGFKWRFVETGVRFMRRHFASDAYQRYLDFADTLQSVPFVQDLPQVQALKDEGFIPDDAVLCNGNSGDYISGAHVVPAMQESVPNLSDEARLDRVVEALIGKHFALWKGLLTTGNRTRISAALRASIARAGAAPAAPDDDYGIYEYAEFQDRQCRYVITGQRIYEFLGHAWRLPLWAKSYLDFWESIPLAGKRQQNLYATMLEEENWGGVWRGLPVNAKTIKPDWIRPIRFVAKLAHAPLGRERWHRFERRYFQYWLSPTGASASVPYWMAIRDSSGARNGVSWLAQTYLARHEVDARRSEAWA